MEVMAIKLTSGEEIVAKVVFNGDEAELTDARALMILPNGQLRLAPVLFSGDISKSVTLNRNTISMHTTNVNPKFLDEYTRSVSPLELPKSSILMG